MNAESVDVTAGLGGFLAFFLLALALYLLMRNMNARMRRMAYRQEQEANEALAAAAANLKSEDGAPPDPGDAPESIADDDVSDRSGSSGRRGGPDVG